MPAAEHERFVAQLGSNKEFRKHFNHAVKIVETKAGYSRSQLVRMHLESVVKASK